MSRTVRAFVLGFVAGAGLGYGTALAISILAQAGDWDGFRVALGPIEFLAFARDGATTSTSFGVGIVLAALAIGAANALAGTVLLRRQATRSL